jgi:hypothetical protein
MKTILSLFLAFLLCVPEAHAQSAASPMPFVKSTFLDGNGAPCNGCLIWTYTAGTTTLLNSYTTTAGNVANTNPVVLNSSGQADVFLGESSYKIALEAAPIPPNVHGAGLWTEDNIQGSAASSLTQYTAPYPNSVSRTITSKLSDIVSVLDFGADKTGVTDSATAFNNALATGFSVYMPCGTYFTGSTVTLKFPGQSLIGGGKGCITWNFVGTTSAINWQMDPFTTNPAGELSGFTLIGTSSAIYGIDGGTIVGAWMHDIDVSGFTGASSAAIHLHSKGNFATWTERNHFGPNVSTGGTGSSRNTHGFLLDADNTQDSFGYNSFEDIKVNVSTGQEGFTLASGFAYNFPQFNMVCNEDSQLPGTVGPICIRSSSNWSDNVVHLNGEYTTQGAVGTGTPYRLQVDSGGRFANHTGSYLDVISPSGAQVADNVIPVAVASPNVSLVQTSGNTSWDTGTFTLNGIAASPQPGVPRGNAASMGMLFGNNLEVPYFSMAQATGAAVPFITVPAGQVIGSGINVGSIGYAGDVHMGSWVGQCNSFLTGCTAPGSIDGTVHQSLSGFTSAHRSGFSNSYFVTTPGINESLSGDVNFSGGWGFVEGTNIAHPMAWGYGIDPVDFEVFEKAFQTPLLTGNSVFQISHGGTITPNGHIDQGGGNTNIAGTCSVSGGTSCAVTFTLPFVSPPVCVHSLYFDVTPNTATYHVTPSVSSCTITFSTVQTGTVSFVAIGNPN